MKRSGKSAHPLDEGDDKLSAAVERLADEVHVLREVLDDIREAFRWAAHNGRLGAPDSPESDQSVSPAITDEAVHEAIAESLDGLRDDVAETIRDQLRDELAGLRTALDQFSVDLEWAVRRICQPLLPPTHDSAAAVPSPQPQQQPVQPAEHRPGATTQISLWEQVG